MKLRLVELNGYKGSGNNRSVALHVGEGVWLPLLPCLDLALPVSDPDRDLLLQCGRDMLTLLREYSTVKDKVWAVVKSEQVRRSSNELRDMIAESLALLPFAPTAIRDASLFDRHLVQAASGLVRKGLAGPVPFVLATLWHYLITVPLGVSFPPLRPSPVFAECPVHYLSNHLNTFTDGSTVPYPPHCTMMDFELEVACVVVADGLRNASYEQARQAIGGYMLFNDLSARNVQLKEMLGAKFGPQKTKSFGNVLGHIVVTPDEIPDFRALKGSVMVNDRKWCEGDTSEALFTSEEVVAYCSLGETLRSGEVIGMGTLPGCAGIESGRELQEGDTVDLQMEPFGNLACKIGTKENVPLDIWRDTSKSRSSTKTNVLPWLMSFVMVLVALLIYLIPSTIDPIPYIPSRHVPVEKRHAPVFYVQDDMVDRWSDDLYAPESLIFDGNDIYASTRDGCVRRLNYATRSNECIIRTPQFNASHILPPLEQCQSETTQWMCGTPLGMRFDHKNDRLLVVDAYYGLLALNQFRTKHPQVRLLVNADEQGKRFHFMNNLDVASDGQIYFTVSSDRRVLYEYLEENLEGRGNGALYRYDPRTNATKLLLEGISFANGVRLNHDESKLFLSETPYARIRRVDLKTGEWDLLIDNMPCLPDNLLVDKERHELVAGCSAPRLWIQDFTARHPWARRLMIKIPLFRYMLDHFRPNTMLVPVINYDTGEISRVLYDKHGTSAHSISEAHFHREMTDSDDSEKTYAYLGSFRNRFLARVQLPEGFQAVQTA